MKDRRCSRRYPRAFRDFTVDDNDGYPEYRRRAVRRTDGSLQQWPLGNGDEVDNTWIVPYNKALLLKYNAHVNVEVCSTLYAVKYLHKYIHKGGDRAEVEYAPNVTNTLDVLAVQQQDGAAEETAPDVAVDEVNPYLAGRYISTSEAVWRILAFAVHATLTICSIGSVFQQSFP